jgi:hypothetical protein
MELERTFSQARESPAFPSEEHGEADDQRLPQVADDSIDSFPREESPFARALLLDDIDAIDRARADEAVADIAAFAALEPAGARAFPSFTPPAKGFRLPALGAGDLAFPAMALLAAIGWGAFLYEKVQPQDRATPVAVTETTREPLTTALEPLPARALTAIAPLPKIMRAARTTSPSPAVAAGVADVSGMWTLTRAVESSSYNAFTGVTFGYELRLQQKGGRITGSGRRVSENGHTLEKQGQVPLHLQGTIAGDKVTLNFTEGTGSRRRSGRFLLVVEDGVLRGRFSSNAASSKGTAQAQRSTS